MMGKINWHWATILGITLIYGGMIGGFYVIYIDANVWWHLLNGAAVASGIFLARRGYWEEQ